MGAQHYIDIVAALIRIGTVNRIFGEQGHADAEAMGLAQWDLAAGLTSKLINDGDWSETEFKALVSGEMDKVVLHFNGQTEGSYSPTEFQADEQFALMALEAIN
mgnify:CR=1 FL=1